MLQFRCRSTGYTDIQFVIPLVNLFSLLYKYYVHAWASIARPPLHNYIIVRNSHSSCFHLGNIVWNEFPPCFCPPKLTSRSCELPTVCKTRRHHIYRWSSGNQQTINRCSWLLHSLKLTATLLTPEIFSRAPKRKRESLPTIYFRDAILVSGSVDEAHGFKLCFFWLCWNVQFMSKKLLLVCLWWFWWTTCLGLSGAFRRWMQDLGKESWCRGDVFCWWFRNSVGSLHLYKWTLKISNSTLDPGKLT